VIRLAPVWPSKHGRSCNLEAGTSLRTICTYRQAPAPKRRGKASPNSRGFHIKITTTYSEDLLQSRLHQRLTDRFLRLVAGRSLHPLSRRWKQSLQILCVHVQLLRRAPSLERWDGIFGHLLCSRSRVRSRGDLAAGRGKAVFFLSPFLFLPLDPRWQRRATASCTAAAAALGRRGLVRCCT
jgi:hypothetical protein